MKICVPFYIVGFLALFVVACSSPTTSPTGPTTSPTSNPAQESDPLIPFDVIAREESGTDKVSFDLRVDLVNGRLPTTKELEAISRSLKSAETTAHERTFVVFYLPDMQVDAGGFATAHHNPNLETMILTANVPYFYRNLVGTEKAENQRQETNSTQPLVKPRTEDLLVELELEVRRNERGQLQLFGKTNLPDKTNLSLSVSNERLAFMAQDKAEVKDSSYGSSWFSYRGAPFPDGTYEVGAAVPIGNTQPAEVTRILGKGLDRMTGPLVRKMDIAVLGKVASVEKTVELK